MLHTDSIPPGFIQQRQYDKIVELAISLPKNSTILEIGAGFGRSTYAWLTGLEDCSLYILDDWEWHHIHDGLYNKMVNFSINDHDWHTIKNINNHFEAWKYFVSSHPNYNYIKNIHSMTTKKYRTQKLKNDFDCVYIDDSHDPFDVSESLNYFSQSSILCGDDYNESWPELCQVIDRFAAQHNKKITVDQSGFWKLT